MRGVKFWFFWVRSLYDLIFYYVFFEVKIGINFIIKIILVLGEDSKRFVFLEDYIK